MGHTVKWHIITGEYPPQQGGVSDYTRLVACALAKAGDQVEVWAPECRELDYREPGIRVHRLPGQFGLRALTIIDRAIGSASRHRILVQYVPHAFGLKAMNLPFSYWLYVRRHRNISVMFHEVAVSRRTARRLHHNLLGKVQALMATLVARSATRIIVSTQAWEEGLRPLVGSARTIEWLPVPSTVPLIKDLGASEAITAKYAAGGLLVGHFGTYGEMIREYLEKALPELLRNPRVSVMMLGRGGTLFREALIRRHANIADRLHATAGLPAGELSIHLSACDLMIQPYPDGITTRRTSAMAALVHGRPVVTTAGRLTEPLWIESSAVATVPADAAAKLAHLAFSLLESHSERQRLALAGAALYRERFDLCHTISTLRAADADCDSNLFQP